MPPVQKGAREAQGLRAEALVAFIFWSISGFVLRNVCVWVSPRASGDWQGRGGTDRRMVSRRQRRTAESSSRCLAPSTRLLCSTSASPDLQHFSPHSCIWSELAGAAPDIGYDEGIGSCSLPHGPTIDNPDREAPQRA